VRICFLNYYARKFGIGRVSNFEKYFQVKMHDFGVILGAFAGYRNTPKDVWGGFILG
jgi:hypothetical protein